MFNLSIITINYNNAKGLKKTIDSVVKQTFEDFEYIIVDGNSTDDSLDVLKSLKATNLNWISEPDTGIYNAMNKGIKIANGEYLLFLNSGDYLINNTILEDVISGLNEKKSFVGCNLVLDYETKKEIKKHPEKISFSYLLRSTILHPSTFIKKEMFYKYGNYNEENKIVSDWEFFFKTIGLHGESFKQIDKELTVFDMNGISSQKDNFTLVNEEKEKILSKYLTSFNNSSLDSFMLTQLKSPSKRIKYIAKIEKSTFLRKFTTSFLYIISKFSK